VGLAGADFTVLEGVDFTVFFTGFFCPASDKTTVHNKPTIINPFLNMLTEFVDNFLQVGEGI
jgi:hypothetical protein